ncbi:hypothetical protein [Amycolatopsis eburnea]|uniref:hypothetical protein n=1 Tax=Amycolatopsis eburnea TaxID=2267691 RepID=UPI0013151FCF|nr:hypothetical protein [Amycolatopsis eburnea]
MLSVVVLTLLAATAAVAVGLLWKMYRADEPLLGGLGICLLVGPGTLLGFLYVGLAA